MALFRKNKTTTEIPELQEYYATQKKESTFVAWLLAFGSLIITAALLVGIFVGGRWVYRKINNKDSNVATTTQTTKATSDESGKAADTTPKQPTETVTVPSVSTSIATAVTKPAQGVSPNQSAQTNKTAVAASKTVPNTGPTESISLFIAIIIIATLAHRSYLIKQSKNS